MEITPINPWPWSLEQGFSQAQLVDGGTKQLFLAGQTSVNELGEGSTRAT